MKQFLENLYELFAYPIFTIKSNSFSLSSITSIIFLLLIVIILSRIVKIFCKQWLLAKLGFDVGNREAISTLIAYFFGTLGTIVVLQASGLNLASLLVVAGGLGIGLGFGLQSIVKDFSSGLIILLGRSIKVDDFVEFGGRQEFQYLKGTVKSISLLFTVIQTKDGGSLIIPNSYLTINPILNWSYEGQKNRLRIPIRVSQSSDIVLLTETVLNVAYMESSVLNNPIPTLAFKDLGDNYAEFELQVWINQIKDADATISTLNYAIEYYLRQQGIELSFPTQQLLLPDYPLPIFIDKHNDYRHSKTPALQPELHQSVSKPLSVRDLLKKVTYFETFTELELRHLIEVGYSKRLEKEEILFNEGEPGDAFYIILSGSVEVFVPKIDKDLSTLKAGSFFGELSLILGIPRTASVRALEPTVLFGLNNKGFKQLLQKQAKLSEVIIKELGKHQEELAERQQQLRQMGLIDKNEDDTNLVFWVRKRIRKLFLN